MKYIIIFIIMQSGRPIDQEYIENLFTLLDKNKDSELRLEEFIESYIFLEEKIKTKKIKVEKMIEDIDLDLEKYKKNLSKHQNEVPICNGLTNESTLLYNCNQYRGF